MEFIKETDTAISLWTNSGIDNAIFESSDEDFFEFIETMSLIGKHHFHSSGVTNENFSFIANSSLSGDAHPCASPDCRQRKLDQLVSFASLYADDVYIQNPFEKIYMRGDKPIREVERREALAGINNYLYLRPLIEAGLIKYATLNVNFCELHSNEIATPLMQTIGKKEDKLIEVLEKHLLEKCKVVFDFQNGDRSLPFFAISGPEEFIEHGTIYLYAYSPMPAMFKQFLGKKTPYSLSSEEIESSRVLDEIIGPIINDLSAQEWHTSLNGTSYLCDNKLQIKLASGINSKAYTANSEAFEKGLKHYLPAVYSREITSLLDLRRKEEESFSVYRDKLNKIMQESKSWSEEEVSKIFRDQLLPEINLIDKKVKDWKVNTRESISQKILFGTATASFGLYGGVLPANMGEVLAALGGASAIAGSLLEYNKTLKEKQEARKNDFYFLWQAGK